MNSLQTLGVIVFFLSTYIFIFSLNWEVVMTRRHLENYAPLPEIKNRAVRSLKEVKGVANPYNFTKVTQKPAVLNDSFDMVKYRMDWTKDTNIQVLTPFAPEWLKESNQLLCKDVTPYMIILVQSEAANAVKRMAIRNTYGALSSDRVNNLRDWTISKVVRLVFMIGKSDEEFVNNKIHEESGLYGDVLQLDFPDDWYSLKVLYGFKYVQDYCGNVSYILKTTDKTFVNVAAFLEVLEEFPVPLVGAFFGHPHLRACVPRHGDTKVDWDKWGKEKFPDFVTGTSYVMTANLLHDVIETAIRIPMVNLEDTFFSGIIRDGLKANLVSLSGIDTSEIPMNPCEFVRTGGLSVTNLDTVHMYGIRDAYIAYGKSCAANHL